MSELEYYNTLIDSEQDIYKRYNALYTLKSINNPASCDLLMKSLDKAKGDLLQHEIAYCLGQMYSSDFEKTFDLKNYLIKIVNNKSLDVITRHEAAEALCHSHDKELVAFLTDISNDINEAEELRETCYLSLKYINEVNDLNTCQDTNNTTKDPSVEYHFDNYSDMNEDSKLDLIKTKMIELISKYTTQSDLDNKFDILNEMYKVLMHFKHFKSKKALEILIYLLEDNRLSPVFLHEVAFFMGQILDSVYDKDIGYWLFETTHKLLENDSVHRMVKHELACAYQSVLLNEADYVKFKDKCTHIASGCKDDLVRESILVGRDNASSTK